ncbi:hypothetical protein WA1_45130 [Scytonema hofmannii PCC 7110]|uniref:Uncharacterized protein n=1 Tax=Scytonema hofmannii PCC 7110 TaxID=128403 RepID=A0A139WWN3_9CYAN|nr:hypothetical protein [Scytonema hofmannii]KYC36847.1 hypothetical protein WA1_45130 [Scytonema hofmannii PCC 7110]
MTNAEQPNRLDLIEALLLQTVQQQHANTATISQIAQQQQANTATVSQIAQQQQANTATISQIAQQQQANTATISQLTQQQAELKQELQDSISHLVSVIGNFVEEAQKDRAIIQELQSEVRGIQTENQRILQYLFGRQGQG